MEHLNERLNDAGQHVRDTLQVTDEMIQRLHDRVMRSLPQEARQRKQKKWMTASVTVAAVAAAVAVAGPQVMQSLKPEQSTAPELIQPEFGISNANESLLTTINDDEKLLLPNFIPLGMKYEEVKKAIPEMSEPRPEGGLEGGVISLTEAFVSTRVLEQDVLLEFNFDQNNLLYSYYYRADALDKQTAEDLQKKLVAKYEQKMGKPAGSESEKGTETVFWIAEPFDLYLTKRVNAPDGKYYVAWGYQKNELSGSAQNGESH